MKVECKCKESYVVIDEASNLLCCGVKGIVDIKNVKASKSQVICVKCNNVMIDENK